MASFCAVRGSSSLAVMHYQRFGEGPEWYAVGKPCSTELIANKYKSMDDLPSETVALFRKFAPGFFGEWGYLGSLSGSDLRQELRDMAADIKRKEVLGLR